jgi:multicomponent Na+:H+ antiporter subunit C
MEMPGATWYILTGIVLSVIGLLGITLSEHLLRKILGLNIMSSGVFLLLVAPADRLFERAPDPVPHAMVLTGIVVAVSATALALALARRIATVSDQNVPEEDAGE